MAMKHQDYFQYLSRISLVGKAYRKFFLYPKINALLKGRLLDVGCGVGQMIAFRPDSVGVDINEFNVNYCKKNGLEVYEMAFDLLPFAEASFDSILLDNVLEHIANPVPLIKEIKRVLRLDGLVVIGVPGLRGYLSDTDHRVFYDEAKLDDLADQMGFDVSFITYTPLWKSVFISHHLRQYCLYTQWKLKVAQQ